MSLIEPIDGIRNIDNGVYSVLPPGLVSSYDGKAKMYERLVRSKTYNRIIWGTHPRDYSDFAAKAILNNKGPLLDIGCGGLAHTAALYAQAKQEIVLLDHSIAMLRIAKNELIRIGGALPNHVSLLQADAFHLPFADACFDTLVSFGTIHCFEDKTAFIGEAFRVLKPGAAFYFTAMVADRMMGRLWMRLLRNLKEFGAPLSAAEMRGLLEPYAAALTCYRKGSMLFIAGTK